MIKAGILSDTHITTRTPLFDKLATRAFRDCDIILHAGDLTGHNILNIFKGKTVYGVHGNMCSHTTREKLPAQKIITIAGYTIGLCHGAGQRHNIEERMLHLFPEADCIIYGHSHQPVCKKFGSILIINPGSFQCTNSYGAPASYAILTIDDNGLDGKLYTIEGYE